MQFTAHNRFELRHILPILQSAVFIAACIGPAVSSAIADRQQPGGIFSSPWYAAGHQCSRERFCPNGETPPDAMKTVSHAGRFEGYPPLITVADFMVKRRAEALPKVPVEKGFNGEEEPGSTPYEQPFTEPDVKPPPARRSGFIDLNEYWDTREFTVFTFNAGAKLPHRFEYFQFLNAYSAFGSNSLDWNAFYTEVNLRRPINADTPLLKHLDWTVQYADGTFARSVLRGGIRWRVHDSPGELGTFLTDVLKLRLGVSFHILETDGSGWQIEYAYRRDFFNKRIYVGGFADHNINDGGTSTWVTETQLGVRLFDQWHAVVEYRYTTFAPARFRSGWGIGLEYIIRFP